MTTVKANHVLAALYDIEINNLTFKYENRTDYALENVTLNVVEKEFVLLAGASGSGKSTLLKCLNGLIPHRYLGDYSGEVKIRNKSVPDSQFLDLALNVGYNDECPNGSWIQSQSARRIVLADPEHGSTTCASGNERHALNI